MNAGIQDAFNLGWKLGLVGSRMASPSLLSSYEDERMPIDAGIIRWTDRGTRLLLSQGPFAHTLRRHGLSSVMRFDTSRRRLAEIASQIGANYRDSRIVAEHFFAGGPHAGDRAPDATIRSIATGASLRLFDLIAQPRHALLLLWPKDVQIWNIELSNPAFSVHRINELGSTSGDYTDVGGSVAEHYGIRPAAYLVRPDGYIAFRCSLSNSPRLLSIYLARIFLKRIDSHLRAA
jgi:hypothetical protein